MHNRKNRLDRYPKSRHNFARIHIERDQACRGTQLATRQTCREHLIRFARNSDARASEPNRRMQLCPFRLPASLQAISDKPIIDAKGIRVSRLSCISSSTLFLQHLAQCQSTGILFQLFWHCQPVASVIRINFGTNSFPARRNMTSSVDPTLLET